MVRLLEIVTSVGQEDDEEDDDTPRTDRKRRGSLYIVLEYLDHDLAGLLDLNITFSPTQMKGLLRQLLEVLAYIHEHKYVHRDIKCSNLLIDNNFRLKVKAVWKLYPTKCLVNKQLADFGLARRLSDVPADLTNRVITLWYRPPELLLGSTRYGPNIDCWGVGCILAELMIGKPLFPAKVELEQLDLIFQVCGTPTSMNWPGHEDLPGYSVMMPAKVYPDKLKEHLGEAARKAGTAACMTGDALNLITRLLALDPSRRISARNALDSLYFHTAPVCPVDIADLGKLELPQKDGSYHEFQTKKKRKEEGKTLLEAKQVQRLKDVGSSNNRASSGPPTKGNMTSDRSLSGEEDMDTTTPEYPKPLPPQGVESGVPSVVPRAPEHPPPPPPPGPLPFSYSGHQVTGSVPGVSQSRNWAPPLPPPSLLAPPPPPAPADFLPPPPHLCPPPPPPGVPPPSIMHPGLTPMGQPWIPPEGTYPQQAFFNGQGYYPPFGPPPYMPGPDLFHWQAHHGQ
ncbi:unnamed protein product [Choristocarpus tenellus]